MRGMFGKALAIVAALAVWPAYGQSTGPLNRQTIAPTPVALQPETSSFISRIQAAGYPLPNATYQAAINQLIYELKAATPALPNGVWGAADEILLLASYNSSVSILNLKNSTYTPALSSTAPTFTAQQGWAGDGTSAKYIDTGFNPYTASSPNYTRNSAHFCMWATSGGLASTYTAGTVTGSFMRFETSSNGGFVGRPNQTASTDASAQIDTAGLNDMTCFNRTSSSSYDIYVGGLMRQNLTTASAALTSTDLAILGNPSTSNYSAATIGFVSIGGALDQYGMLRLRQAVKHYLIAIGQTTSTSQVISNAVNKYRIGYYGSGSCTTDNSTNPLAFVVDGPAYTMQLTYSPTSGPTMAATDLYPMTASVSGNIMTVSNYNSQTIEPYSPVYSSDSVSAYVAYVMPYGTGGTTGTGSNVGGTYQLSASLGSAPTYFANRWRSEGACAAAPATLTDTWASYRVMIDNATTNMATNSAYGFFITGQFHQPLNITGGSPNIAFSPSSWGLLGGNYEEGLEVARVYDTGITDVAGSGATYVFDYLGAGPPAPRGQWIDVVINEARKSRDFGHIGGGNERHHGDGVLSYSGWFWNGCGSIGLHRGNRWYYAVRIQLHVRDHDHRQLVQQCAGDNGRRNDNHILHRQWVGQRADRGG
jgi:hypothetical protein